MFCRILCPSHSTRPRSVLANSRASAAAAPSFLRTVRLKQLWLVLYHTIHKVKYVLFQATVNLRRNLWHRRRFIVFLLCYQRSGHSILTNQGHNLKQNRRSVGLSLMISTATPNCIKNRWTQQLMKNLENLSQFLETPGRWCGKSKRLRKVVPATEGMSHVNWK